MTSNPAQAVELVSAEGALLGREVISQHLRTLGHPERSIASFERCGEKLGFQMVGSCGCGFRPVDMRWSCCLRVCEPCSKKRQKRLKQRYLSALTNLQKQRGNDQFYFLTLSNPSYDTFEQGLKHCKDSFKKFLRTDYVKARIKGGLYVTETTKSPDGKWHVHNHAILYGRRLDNAIRGTCLECEQHLIKYDKKSKTYFCANSKCHSEKVSFKKDSKIVSLYKKASGQESNAFIEKMQGASTALNYLLKYISTTSDVFTDVKDIAIYIKTTHKKKLVTTFGLFFKIKYPKLLQRCYECGEPIHFEFDTELVNLISGNLKFKHPPPDLNAYI